MFSIVFWKIYLYVLAQNYLDKLKAVQWVLIVFLLLQIRFVLFETLSDNNQADVIEAFNSTLRYIDDLLTCNIDNPYFEQMVALFY